MTKFSCLAAVLCAAAGQRLLTRDELRACMDSESVLVGRRAELEKRSAALRAEGDEIKKEGDEIREEQERQANEQPLAAQRFQRRVKAYNARIAAGNKNLADLRADTDTLGKDYTAYNGRCTGVGFRPEDKEAVLKEREAKK